MSANRDQPILILHRFAKLRFQSLGYAISLFRAIAQAQMNPADDRATQGFVVQSVPGNACCRLEANQGCLVGRLKFLGCLPQRQMPINHLVDDSLLGLEPLNHRFR